ncbi:MAG: hypothetical protein LKF74_03930 [Megasphaera sp.]|jgi:uncharacterized protein (DUF697 family)|nr:hypothetical protein [Megasphaera sp.]MCH4187966.1 hypothetical protein [Megasphaera sp.]MCH4217686.1 hypothetical protein [Megasphaera sp.]
MTEEAKTVEQLQEEITQLKQELETMKNCQSQQGTPDVPSGEQAALDVIQKIDESTEDVDLKVETLCRWAAARAGAIVVAPLVGTVALMANEVYLVGRIAKIYNVKLSEKALIAFLGAVGSRMAGNLLTTLIPFSAIQVPVAVGITYSLGRVTQRWLKDGMPTDMGPYMDMMGEWKEKAREQVDKLRENPLKNVPLGDETIDFMKKWGDAAKGKFEDVKEKGQELYQNVRHQNDLVEEIKEEKDAEDAAEKDAPTATETAADAPAEPAETTVEEQVKAAVEDAKKPLEDN